jgi:hypothetical protein
MACKYKIYPERNLLVDVMTGDISFDELVHLSLTEIHDPDIQGTFRIISDITDANLAMRVDQMKEFIGHLKDPQINSKFRWAILTASPYSTAISMILAQDPGFIDLVGVFSTLEACCDFVGVKFVSSEFSDSDFKILV